MLLSAASPQLKLANAYIFNVNEFEQEPLCGGQKPSTCHSFLKGEESHVTACAYSTVGSQRTGGRQSQPGSFLFFKTPANLVLIFQSDFESRRLACGAHTVRDDACRAGNVA